MRSTPTAVGLASAPADETVEVARAASAITHGDPAAGWGTALYHLMIRAALHGDDPFDVLASELPRLPTDQHRYRRMLAPDWTPDLTRRVPMGCTA